MATDPGRKLVEYTHPECGHTKRMMARNAAKRPASCWECRKPSPEQMASDALERKRDSARASYHRRKNAPKLTDEELSTQRALVGFLRTAHYWCDPAAVWWPRPLANDDLTVQDAYEAILGPTTGTVDFLTWCRTLDIPATVYVVAETGPTVLLRVDLTPDLDVRELHGLAQTLDQRTQRLAPAVRAEDLDTLARWAPTFVRRFRDSHAL